MKKSMVRSQECPRNLMTALGCGPLLSNKVITWETNGMKQTNVPSVGAIWTKECAGSTSTFTPRPEKCGITSFASNFRVSHLPSPISRPNLLGPYGVCAPTQFGLIFGALRSRLNRHHPRRHFIVLFSFLHGYHTILPCPRSVYTADDLFSCSRTNMSSMVPNADGATKRASTGEAADQGESKKAALGDKVYTCSGEEVSQRCIVILLVCFCNLWDVSHAAGGTAVTGRRVTENR